MSRIEILIIAVIYNTFPETLRFLQSIAGETTDDLHVILVDNSESEPGPEFRVVTGDDSRITYLKTGENTGYFHGARAGLDHFTATYGYHPEWILVTNVDILFTPGFFDGLKKIPVHDNLGLVAPAIISHRWKTDYNPALTARYPKQRLKFYLFIYSSAALHNVYLSAAYLLRWAKGVTRKKSISKGNPPARSKKIYAPHGSCLVFNKRYFDCGGNLNLPHFLFGEEIFIGETARRIGVVIEYHPQLVIDDHEHASTGFFVSPATNRYYYQSIRSILDHFYQDER